jgi:hypothetical protein
MADGDPMTQSNADRARDIANECTEDGEYEYALKAKITAALDAKDRELSALRAANACLVAGLEQVARQRTADEYYEEEGEPAGDAVLAEAYRLTLVDARESLARARELLGGKSG